MDADELLRVAAQADFDDQTAFAEQVWTVNGDGTIRIEASPGTEPTVLHLNDQEEDQNGEEEEESIPQCAGSSTSITERRDSNVSTIMDPDMNLEMPTDDAHTSDADVSPSASQAESAPQENGASPAHRRSHAFAYNPYARSSNRTRATLSCVEAGEEGGDESASNR